MASYHHNNNKNLNCEYWRGKYLKAIKSKKKKYLKNMTKAFMILYITDFIFSNVKGPVFFLYLPCLHYIRVH